MRLSLKCILVLMMSAGLAFSATQEAQKAADTTQPKTPADSPQQDISMDDVSYCIGLEIGQNFNNSQININLDMLKAGILDGMDETKEPKLSRTEQRSIMMAFQKEMMSRRQQIMAELEEKKKKLGELNLKKSLAFMKENLAKPNIKKTESGLQYIVVKEGDGPNPKATDTVKVHYRGTLIDGTEFDSSYSRGEPAEFQVQGVIPGWIEGIQLMKVGGKYKFFIPPELAYSYRGAEPDIGPNEALIFDVELLGIKE